MLFVHMLELTWGVTSCKVDVAGYEIVVPSFLALPKLAKLRVESEQSRSKLVENSCRLLDPDRVA